MRDFLISTARALWKFIIRYSDLAWALGVSILGVFLQRAFYFKDNPFFGLEYFGEVLISSGIFLLVYFFHPAFGVLEISADFLFPFLQVVELIPVCVQLCV